MMKQSLLSSIKYWLWRFMQLQLFLTIVSLPILIAWGLPISLLSPLGNLIFSPFITVFLFLSSLIFFFELGHIPNEWLIYCLDKVTQLWISLVGTADNSWLVGFIKPALPVLVVIPLLAFIILQCKKTADMRRSTLGFVAILLAVFVYLKMVSAPKKHVEHLACNKGHVTIIKNEQNTILIDPGFIGQRINAESWTEYTLMPHMIKTLGCRIIDHCIVMQPGKLTFDALQVLCTKAQVKNLYLILWEGTLPPSAWKSFFKLKECAANSQTTIKRIGSKEQTIDCAKLQLTITPLEQHLTYHDAQYPALRLDSCIDNQSITIYSAKYRKPKAPKTEETEALNGTS